MRKNFFLFPLIILASFSISNAQTIDNIVESTFKNNFSLKALEESTKSTKEQIGLSSKWQNPTLTFGINDIQFDDVSKRDLEPMQSQFIGFSQIIPIGEKLQKQEDIAKNDYKISKYLLEERKLEYKSKIYEYIYKAKLLEEKLALFQELKLNILKLEELLTKLYKYNKATQIQIINTQVLYQELNLKSQKLQTLLNTINLNLEEITYEKIKNINIDTKIKKIKLLTNINSHPKILSLIQSSKKQDNISILEKEKKNSDIKVSLNYFQRDEKYEDYINIAFAIPLSLRGIEDIKSRQAKIKTVEINHNIQDLKLSFENKIKILQENIDDSITSLDIINNKILPKFNHLQKVLESYNSFNSFGMIDTKSLINNLNEIIKYKLKAIDEKDKYFKAIAKSIYYTKEI